MSSLLVLKRCPMSMKGSSPIAIISRWLKLEAAERWLFCFQYSIGGLDLYLMKQNPISGCLLGVIRKIWLHLRLHPDLNQKKKAWAVCLSLCFVWWAQ